MSLGQVARQPLAVDLFCGLGGWTEGLLAQGYYVIGFDVERHVYGEHRYPGQLVIQDVLTLHGKQFKDAALIVASPPCQTFSWMAMPWKKAKAKAAAYRSGELDVADLTRLFDACFRIQREACAAAGRHIPLVVENVRGAQPWVGRSRGKYGSFHFWGDVPTPMPMAAKRGTKVGGLDWSKYGEADYRTSGAGGCFGDSAIKNTGGSWFAVAHDKRNSRNDPRDAFKGVPHRHSGQLCNFGGKSTKRKMASALIAKIPFAVSSHIGRVFYPCAEVA